MEAEELGYKSGIYYTMLGYTAMTTEERKAIGYDEDRFAPLIEFVCLKDGFDRDEFYEAKLDANWDYAWDIGNVGEYNFFAIVGASELPDGFRSPFIEEYVSLLDLAPDIIYDAEYYAPENPYTALIGEDVFFDTEDLYGNPVSSSELFEKNKITMVNVWATWCGHCVEELPQLEQINRRLQNIGCGIIGVLSDCDDSESVETAQDIVDSMGVTYPVVKMTEEMESIFNSSSLPISYFVSRDGQIVGTPVEGAMVNKYYEAVEDLLTGGTETDIVTTSPGSIPEAPEYAAPDSQASAGGRAPFGGYARSGDSDASEYRIICLDEEGDPLEGCTVQFCSDSTCMVAKTDRDGVAAFREPPGNYTVHLLKPPAGYAKDSTEYTAPTTYGDLVITVKAA
jgi:thiol-disulfide isomerase/thioredoxin